MELWGTGQLRNQDHADWSSVPCFTFTADQLCECPNKNQKNAAGFSTNHQLPPGWMQSHCERPAASTTLKFEICIHSQPWCTFGREEYCSIYSIHCNSVQCSVYFEQTLTSLTLHCRMLLWTTHLCNPFVVKVSLQHTLFFYVFLHVCLKHSRWQQIQACDCRYWIIHYINYDIYTYTNKNRRLDIQEDHFAQAAPVPPSILILPQVHVSSSRPSVALRDTPGTFLYIMSPWISRLVLLRCWNDINHILYYMIYIL